MNKDQKFLTTVFLATSLVAIFIVVAWNAGTESRKRMDQCMLDNKEVPQLRLYCSILVREKGYEDNNE